jgi:hypothetical protein
MGVISPVLILSAAPPLGSVLSLPPEARFRRASQAVRLSSHLSLLFLLLKFLKDPFTYQVPNMPDLVSAFFENIFLL